MKQKLSNYIAEKLLASGITDVFMITGGGAMHLDDALGHQEGLHCLYNHHEQACAIAAEAYARIHNKIGALCVTTGPGGTNAITGVVGGWLDSIPMLVLSGQVRYDTTARWSGVGIRAMGDQEFDIVKSIDCMTKYSEMVIDPLRIRYCLEKAIYLSYSGRPGPTWLDIPLDVQGAYVDTDDLVGFDAADYEAGGTGWAEPSPAHAIPEDYAGKGEHRQVLPKPVSKELAREIRFCMLETESALPARSMLLWKWQTDWEFRQLLAGMRTTACTMTVRGTWADRATWATVRAIWLYRTVIWYFPWEAA